MMLLFLCSSVDVSKRETRENTIFEYYRTQVPCALIPRYSRGIKCRVELHLELPTYVLVVNFNVWTSILTVMVS